MSVVGYNCRVYVNGALLGKVKEWRVGSAEPRDDFVDALARLLNKPKRRRPWWVTFLRRQWAFSLKN